MNVRVVHLKRTAILHELYDWTMLQFQHNREVYSVSAMCHIINAVNHIIKVHDGWICGNS